MGDASKPHIVSGVDLGHGGYDNGAEAISASGELVLEKSITLAVGQIVKTLVPDVYLTRNGDDSLSHVSRVKSMRQCGASIVVSLHCDSTPWSPATHGTHGYYRQHDAYGQKLARFAVDNTPEPLRPERSGVICAHDNPDTREDDWKRRSQGIVMRYQPATVVLVEFGYLSNEDDLSFLSTREGQRACAALVVQILSEYRRLITGD